MKKIWRKFIVFAAIGLFIGSGILPSINSNVTFDDIDQEQQQEDINGYWILYNWTWAQSFIPQLNVLTRVKIKLFTNQDDTSDILKVSIRKSLDNKDLTNITKMLNHTTDNGWIEFDFEDIAVTIGDTYYIICMTLNDTILPKCYNWYFAWSGWETPGPYQDGCIYYSNDRYTWLNISTYDDDFCFITYGYNDPNAKSDLECIGGLNWNNAATGETVNGNFSIKNIGFAGSFLDWNISNHPDWGNWTFYPEFDNDLTPADGTQTIYVTVVAPEQKNYNFSGEIKIVNTEEPNDYETIGVSLTTSKNKAINQPFFLFLENHPHLFQLLRKILGL